MLDGERATGEAAVEVRVPADRSQLFVLRSLVAAIALREDFDLDEVEDVKLAVDELCSALVMRARANEVLACRFEAGPGSVGLHASVATEHRRPIPQDTFGWRVLATLADDVTTWITPGLRPGYVLHIRMTKSKSGGLDW
jgi:serine/threonine-protein kinase RsbW